MRNEIFLPEPHVNDIVKLCGLTGTKSKFNGVFARILEVRGVDIHVILDDGKDFWIIKGNAVRVLQAKEIES